jgi:hypothetical protein
MSGMKRTAPCGHPGETVIGAYVRCLQGCSQDPYLQPQAVVVDHRREPGHVDFCACKPCTVRRRARKVVLRTKGGKTATVDWNGVATSIQFNSEFRDTYRHWKLVDEDGDVLADGMCDVYTEVGDPLRININTLIPVKLAVHNPIRRFDPGNVQFFFGNVKLEPGTIECLKSWTFKYNKL